MDSTNPYRLLDESRLIYLFKRANANLNSKHLTPQVDLRFDVLYIEKVIVNLIISDYIKPYDKPEVNLKIQLDLKHKLETGLTSEHNDNEQQYENSLNNETYKIYTLDSCKLHTYLC